MEIIGIGHKVGLAIELDQDPDAAAVVYVARHDPLIDGTVGPLGRLRLTLAAQEVDGCLDVGASVLQCSLAIHHPRARAVTEFLDGFRPDLHCWHFLR